MKFKFAGLLFIVVIQLVQGGVVYNPESVCNCVGPDNMMYPCLCSSKTVQDQTRSKAYMLPDAQSGNYNSFENYFGQNANSQLQSNHNANNQYWQPGVSGNYYQRYHYK